MRQLEVYVNDVKAGLLTELNPGKGDARIKRVLDKYMQVPELTTKLVGNSFLNDKMKRTYLRIVDERVKRFIRDSE